MLIARDVRSCFVAPSLPGGAVSGDATHYLDGVSQHLQCFTVSLIGERDIVLVSSQQGGLSGDVIAKNAGALEAHVGGALLAFWRTPDAVYCGHRGFEPQVAAAAAIVKYSASWDESRPIVVEFDGARYGVHVEFRDAQWHATVEADLTA